MAVVTSEVGRAHPTQPLARNNSREIRRSQIPICHSRKGGNPGVAASLVKPRTPDFAAQTYEVISGQALSLPVRIDAPISTEKPIPEIVDHRKIAIGMPVVEEMELLLSPEPGKSSQP